MGSEKFSPQVPGALFSPQAIPLLSYPATTARRAHITSYQATFDSKELWTLSPSSFELLVRVLVDCFSRAVHTRFSRRPTYELIEA
jgi:hypothetical protein